MKSEKMMGLGLDVLEMIFREHAYQPIIGDVLLIGRQTVLFTPHEILDLMSDYHCQSHISLEEIQIDKETKNRADDDLISDFSLFQMLGAKSVRALDHSDYECANVIHNLTKPIPDNLKEIADFIIDGSTLDNTFNPALTLKNYADLLRPGGKMILGNMYSNHHQPYNMMPPLWYLDYFVMNQFIDCKVYILLSSDQGHNAFCINFEYLLDPSRFVSSFRSVHEMACLVFAEKGIHSTTDFFPSQQHYRSDTDWKIYRHNLSLIQSNPRPHLLRSRSPFYFLDCAAGHLFMNDQFVEVDPTTEWQRNHQYGVAAAS